MADRLFLWLLRGCAALAALLVLLVVGFVGLESVPALGRVGTGFVTGGAWYPAESAWDLTPMLWGSVLSTLGAVVIAVPLGVVSAVFRHFYAPAPVGRAYARLIALLAGIPSVVYGLWGLVVLVPLIAALAPPGPSLLAAMLVLALMILPTVALVVDAALAQVPRAHLSAAHALGLTREAVIWRVAVPGARAGIVTGAILGAARAIGETMAVLMVCGGVVNTPHSLFDPIRTLTANIALEMAYALEVHRSALFVSGLALVAAVIALVSVAGRMEGRVAGGAHG